MPPARKRTPAKAEKPQEVDVTVKNQESLGSGEVVDRNPGPQLVEDPTTGGLYDVSKSNRELVDPDAEEVAARRARVRQTDAALNAKDLKSEKSDDETPKVKLEFLKSGLTAFGKVWKKGEILEIEDTDEARQPHKDTEGKVWFDQSAKEQEERYGKVFFEKR